MFKNVIEIEQNQDVLAIALRRPCVERPSIILSQRPFIPYPLRQMDSLNKTIKSALNLYLTPLFPTILRFLRHKTLTGEHPSRRHQIIRLPTSLQSFTRCKTPRHHVPNPRPCLSHNFFYPIQRIIHSQEMFRRINPAMTTLHSMNISQTRLTAQIASVQGTKMSSGSEEGERFRIPWKWENGDIRMPTREGEMAEHMEERIRRGNRKFWARVRPYESVQLFDMGWSWRGQRGS